MRSALCVRLICMVQRSGSGWKDPTKHDVRFISVDEGVRLEPVLREIHAFIAGLPPAK